MTNDELTTRILKALWRYDDKDRLSWYFEEDGTLRFCINCNDLFYWGCADAEDITEENIDLLEQTYEEVRALAEPFLKKGRSTEKRDMDAIMTYSSIVVSASALFCARSRKMRPQGACYTRIPKEMWPLFHTAGPERPSDKEMFGNPYNPGEYDPSTFGKQPSRLFKSLSRLSKCLSQLLNIRKVK